MLLTFDLPGNWSLNFHVSNNMPLNMLCFKGAAIDCHILASNSCLHFNFLGRSFYQFQCDKQTPGWEDEIKNKEEEREALVIHNEGG